MDDDCNHSAGYALLVRNLANDKYLYKKQGGHLTSWNTVKLDSADTAFSLYVRTKAGWQCVRCGRPATGRGLHAAHLHGRRKESVRFDEQNVDSLCANCHRHFTNNYSEHKAWKLEQLGQKQYDLLMLRANQTGEKNRQAEKLYWKQKLRKEFGII